MVDGGGPLPRSDEGGAHTPEAEGIAGTEPRGRIDPDLVHEGPILRAKIGDPPAVLLPCQLRVVGGDVVILERDRAIRMPPDCRAGEQGEARPERQAVAVRI